MHKRKTSCGFRNEVPSKMTISSIRSYNGKVNSSVIIYKQLHLFEFSPENPATEKFRKYLL